MKAVYFGATALIGAAMFFGGFRDSSPLDRELTAEPQQGAGAQLNELSAQELAAQGYLSVDTLEIRIDDGEVQWYDGTVWHTVGMVEDMIKEDKFYAAQENFREFEEELEQQQEERRAEQESVGERERGAVLLVGEKVAPKPAEKLKTPKPAVTAPVPDPVVIPEVVPEPTAAPENSGGNSGGGDSGNSGGGNSGGGDSGNTGGGNPGGGDSGSTGGDNPGGDSGSTGGDNPGGDSGNTGDDSSSGDGENMEWSDDYL